MKVTKHDGRYQLTERRNAVRPTDEDPAAQAFRKHSGVFDMRDTHSEHIIVATSRNLFALRHRQAVLNTKEVLG